MSGSFSDGGRTKVKKAGSVIGNQPSINFIEGANVTITTTDDGANGEVDITIAASVTGASGVDVEDEGLAEGTATTINFVGDGVTAVVVGSTATVTIPGATVADGSITLAKMANIATDRIIGRDTAGTGVPEALTVSGGVEFSGSGGIQRSALTGDVTASAGSSSTTISNNAVTTAKILDANVTFAKIQNVSATDRLLGRVSASAGVIEEVTCTDFAQSLLDDADASTARTTLGLGTAATSATGDFAAASHSHAASDITSGTVATARLGSGTANSGTFLRGDQTWAAPAGGGDALTSGTLAQFAATTSAQLAGVISDETGSGALVFANTPTLVTPVLGVASATSLNKVAITAPATSATLTIADGATLTASATATVSGTNTGDQTITLTGPITGSGTGSFATTIADAELAAIAGLTSAADRLPYFTGSGTAALATFTAAGRALVDDADAAAQLVTLGAIGGSTGSTDNVLVRADGTGGKTLQTTGITISDTNGISGHISTQNVQSGTTYTVASTDAGKHLIFTSGSAVTVTIPDSLLVGFQCSWEQRGAGKVSFNGSAVTAATLNCRSSGHVASAGQYGVGGISIYTGSGSGAVATLYGDTGT